MLNELEIEILKDIYELAALLDSSLFKYHQLTNNTTTQVLQYLLNQS